MSAEQQQDILDRISLLNPKAKVLKTCQSKVNVMDILNTKLYSRADMEEDSVMISATKVELSEKVETEETMESCCKKSLTDGKVKCCKSKNNKNPNMVDSGLSQLTLGVVMPLSSGIEAANGKTKGKSGK